MAKNKSLFDKDAGILDLPTVQKFIETVTDNAGLQVKFDPNAVAPCTNKNVLIIPAFNDKTTLKDLQKLRWWVLHESLHHTKGPDVFDMGEKELGFDARHSPLAFIWNLFEDCRIEKAGSKDYRGDKQILNDGWRTLVEDNEEKLKEVLKNSEGAMRKVGAAWYANLKSRSEWSPAAVEMESMFEKCMPDDMKDMVKKLEDAGIVDKLSNLREDRKGSRESLNLAKETFEILFDEDADEHIKRKRQERQQAEGEGKSGRGNNGGKSDSGGKESGSGTGKGPGNKSDGSDTPDSKKDGSGNGGTDGRDTATAGGDGKLAPPSNDGESCQLPSGAKVSYEVYGQHEHVVKKPGAPGGTGIQLDYTEHRKKGQNWDYVPCDNIHWARYRNNTFSDNDIKNHEANHHYAKDKKVDEINAHHKTDGIPGKGFGNKVRQLLQIRSQARYQGGMKKGKLHFKNVYRACTNIPSYGERVFRQKTTSDTLDTCVQILTDLSGSMNGQKFLRAVDSSILLNTSIAKSLRIPVEILAFTEYGPDTFIGIVKEADEPSNDEKIIENFARASTFMSANADGDAILWAYDRLKQRQQKRKIMIVISDGSPAASRPGDAYHFTKKVVHQIEGEGIVEIYAIGIMNPNVKDIYSESVVINHPSELEKEVLTLIKRSIFR